MNFEKEGIKIANIYNKKSDKKKKKGKELFVTPKIKDLKDPKLIYDRVPGENIFLAPRGKERDVLYITGSSGSGKSHFAGEYIEEYVKKYPKNPIYVLSTISQDESIDKVKAVQRVNLGEEFMNTVFTLEDFENSLLLFDDIDVIVNKKLKKKLFDILNNLLQTGRHSSTTIIYTSHIATNGNDTRVILSEATSITCFPKTMNGRSRDYLLKSYIGLNQIEIEEIKCLKSRSVTFIRGFPGVVLHENGAWIINGEYL